MSFAKLPANKPSQRNTTNPTNQHNPNSKKSGSGSSSLQVDAPFPVLSLEELRSNLEDCGLGYSSEQLAKASSEDVTCIFRTISNFLVGAAEDPQVPFELLEFHEDSLPDMVLGKKLMDLMPVIGIKNFSIKDLAKPDPDQFRLQLSALLNFVKVREEKLALVLPWSQAQDELVAQLNEARLMEEEVFDQVQQIKAQREAEDPMVQQINHECQSTYAVELTALSSAHNALKAEVAGLAQQQGELEEKLKMEKVTLSTQERECQNVQSQIVRSPEKLKSNMLEMAANLEQEKKAENDVERSEKEHSARYDGLVKLEGSIHKLIKRMHTAEEEQERVKALQKDVKTNQHAFLQSQEAIKEIESKETLLRRQIASCQEKSQALVQKHCQKRDEAQLAINTARSEKVNLETEAQVQQAKIAQLDSQRKRVEQKMAEARAEHEASIRAMMLNTEKLANQVRAYHTDLFKMIASLNQATSISA